MYNRIIWICSLLVLSRASTYPSTYPFTFEEDLPVGAPEFKVYDDPEDPGGYFRNAIMCDYNDHADKMAEEYFAPNFHCDAYWFRLSTLGYSSTDFVKKGDQNFNCTAKGPDKTIDAAYLQEHATYDGDKSYTCEPYVGSKVWYVTSMSQLQSMLLAASCGTAQEPFVCWFMYTGFVWCFNQYISPGVRQNMVPCLDNAVVYFLSCGTFVDPIDMTGYDTQMYVASLSVYQSFVMWTIQYGPDRVCYPYSYYNPASETPDTSESSPSPSGTDESDSDDSSALGFGIPFFEFV